MNLAMIDVIVAQFIASSWKPGRRSSYCLYGWYLNTKKENVKLQSLSAFLRLRIYPLIQAASKSACHRIQTFFAVILPTEKSHLNLLNCVILISPNLLLR